MAADGEVIVKIAADGSRATLVAPPRLDRAMFTPDTLRLIIRQAGVVITPEVDQHITAFLEAYADGEAEHAAVIAEATPPTRGEDGFVTFSPGLDPTAPPPPTAATGDDADPDVGADAAGCDHYAARISTQVRCGDLIGIIHPPTPGSDGRNVLGHVIDARPGRPVPFRFDDTLLVDARGHITAQLDGILLCRRNQLSISQLLDIPGDVDFSTGRIDFTGSATIGGAVRPGFNIHVTDNLLVRRLIEGVQIQCGGNLAAPGGMVGQGHGQVTVGGDAHFAYINDIKGVINGDLTVDREIIDCNLATGRDLLCPNGNIIGGHLVVTGSLNVKVLGSEGWTPTIIGLGDVPLLRHAHRRAARQVDTLRARFNTLTEQEQSLKASRRLTHSDKERLTELEFEISEARNELNAATSRLHELEAAIENRRRIDVHIARAVHPRVTLRIGEVSVCFRKMIRGPLWIGRDANGQLAYRVGHSECHPLAHIADISVAAPEAA